MKSITIIGGSGWLGQYLQSEFNLRGYTYKVSSRTNKGNEYFSFEMGKPVKEIPPADTYIFCLPPSAYEIKNLDVLERLIPYSKKIIYTSSTSVYSSSFIVCHEDNELIIDESVNKKVIETELFFKNHFNNFLIFRLAGLIDKHRHPAKYLSGKKQLPGANHPVNLVHGKDVASIISLAVEKDLRGIFNICCNEHPTKKEYYTKCCEQLGLTPPEFANDTSKGKTIPNQKIVSKLNYAFIHPSPYIF